MNFKKTTIAAVILIALASIAFAVQYVAPLSFSVNQSISAFYNITVNNSAVGSVNISQVNVTLPNGFSFTAGTNGTSVAAANVSFSTLGQVITWANVTRGLVMNVSNQSFWFNAASNSTNVGTFHFNVSLVNTTGVSYYDIVVTVNDTLSPADISFVGTSPVDGANLSQNYVAINATASDNFNVSMMNITFYNVSYSIINTTSANASVVTLNVTPLVAGVYYYNVTAVDNAGNLNVSETRKVTIDTTAPGISVSQNTGDTTSAQVAMDITVTESGSGISSCTVNSTTSSPTSWTGLSQEVIETRIRPGTAIVCGNTVIRNITCTDYAGNQQSTVYSMSSTSCPDSSSSTSGSASTTTTNTSGVTWSGSYYQSTDELSNLGPIEQSLAKLERVGVKVGGSLHYVGALKIYSSSADIQVQSTPQNATLNVGETKKFELTGDNYYDLAVTLDLIQSSKANFTISEIHEIMPGASADTATTTTAQNTAQQKTTSGNSSAQNTSASGFSLTSIKDNAKQLVWWAVGVLALLVVIAAAWVVIKRRAKKGKPAPFHKKR